MDKQFYGKRFFIAPSSAKYNLVVRKSLQRRGLACPGIRRCRPAALMVPLCLVCAGCPHDSGDPADNAKIEAFCQDLTLVARDDILRKQIGLDPIGSAWKYDGYFESSCRFSRGPNERKTMEHYVSDGGEIVLYQEVEEITYGSAARLVSYVGFDPDGVHLQSVKTMEASAAFAAKYPLLVAGFGPEGDLKKVKSVLIEWKRAH